MYFTLLSKNKEIRHCGTQPSKYCISAYHEDIEKIPKYFDKYKYYYTKDSHSILFECFIKDKLTKESSYRHAVVVPNYDNFNSGNVRKEKVWNPITWIEDDNGNFVRYTKYDDYIYSFKFIRYLDDFEMNNNKVDLNKHNMENIENTSAKIAGLVFIILVLIISVLCNRYCSNNNDNVNNSSKQLAEANTPADWNDNPTIDIDIFLIHNGLVRKEKLVFTGFEFKKEHINATNYKIDRHVIDLLSNRRKEINDSVKTEFNKLGINGKCNEEVIDGSSYFVCPI